MDAGYRHERTSEASHRVRQSEVVFWGNPNPTTARPNLSHENETHACRHAGLNFHLASWTAHHPGQDQKAAAHQPGEKHLPPFRTNCASPKGRRICAADRCGRNCQHDSGSHKTSEQKGAPKHFSQSPDICPRAEIKSLKADICRIEFFEKTMRRDVYFGRLVWRSRIPICHGMLPYFFAL